MRIIKSLVGFRAGLLLAISITFTIYLRALQNDFVRWDDYSYIFDNLNIRSINLSLIKWSFTDTAAGHWIPMTWLSFAFDYSVWGLNPAGYHLSNILLHSLNVLLVFILAIIIVQLNNHDKSGVDNKALITGFVTSLLFGIHPMHVESVAWATERKDVLSVFFFLLSLLLYIRYTSSEGLKKYICYISSFFLFMIALMSKPMAISLPIILIILDFFALKRLTRVGDLQKILIEKLPFFGLSILSAVLTIWAAASIDIIESLDKAPFINRGISAVWAYIFYLVKMLIPFNLSPLYPYQQKIDFFTLKYSGSVLFFLIITFFCCSQVLKNKKWLLGVWLYYVVTLIPVIGIITAGPQAAADRFTYLPSLGPFFIFGIGVSMLLESSTYRRLVILLLICLSSIYITQTSRQIFLWHDSITMWSRVIKLFPDTVFIAYHNRGIAYHGLGDYNKAMQDYKITLKINPNDMHAHNNLGLVYLKTGKIEEAQKEFMMAIKIKPDFADAHNNLGLVYSEQGKASEAIKEFMAALISKPSMAGVHINIGDIYYKQGQLNEAMEEFKVAVKINPDFVSGHNKLAGVYSEKGMQAEAMEEYLILSRLEPDNAEIHYKLGRFYHAKGNLRDAEQEFTTAIGLRPLFAEGHNDLGIVYAEMGRLGDAINEFQVAVRQKPDYADAHYNLGNAYSSQGRLNEAIEAYKKSAILSPSSLETRFNLGIAYLRKGLKELAKTEFTLVLKARPDDKLAKQALESLGSKGNDK